MPSPAPSRPRTTTTAATTAPTSTPPPRNQGGQYRTTEAVDVQADHRHRRRLQHRLRQAGEYLDYTVNVTAAGNYRLELRTATTAAGKTVDVLMGATLIADNLAVTNTGNYQTFATVTVPSVALTAGTQELKVSVQPGLAEPELDPLHRAGDLHPRDQRRLLQPPGQELRHRHRHRQLRRARTVSSCGTCTSPQTCGASNVARRRRQPVHLLRGGERHAAPSPMVRRHRRQRLGRPGHLERRPRAATARSPPPATPPSPSPSPPPGRSRCGAASWWGRPRPRTTRCGRASTTAPGYSGTTSSCASATPATPGTRSTTPSPAANALVTRNLTAGTHTLEVAYRENGLKMDRFLVTNDLAFVPSP